MHSSPASGALLRSLDRLARCCTEKAGRSGRAGKSSAMRLETSWVSVASINMAASFTPLHSLPMSARLRGCYDRNTALLQYFDRHAEDVAHAALGADVLRPGRVGLDLPPQPEDLHVDRAVVDLRAVEPREIEQLLAREHALRRRAQRLQPVELAQAELDALAFGRDQPATAQVELPAGETIGAALLALGRGYFARGLLAAQHGADARGELSRRGGLEDVVVGAELEAHHAVGLVLLAWRHAERHRALRAT